MTGPYTLSILNRAKKADGNDDVKTVSVQHASVEEVGHLAHNLSVDNPWFVVIQDSGGCFQGAFLNGDYIESSTPQDDIIQLAELWQSDAPARS